MNRNGEFVNEMELENLNETLAKGRVTWCARNQESVIDYMLVNGRMCEILDHMWIDEDGMIDIVLDHNMLVLEYKLYGREGKSANTNGRKWRLWDVGWENFQVDLSEQSWEDECLNGVDELNDRFVENVKNAAAIQIGYVRTGARKRACKPWWNDEIGDARRERKKLNRVYRQLRKKEA
ncbi:hypothetical protein E2C01_035716 [Portunus trituberculatus]|uniref:Endonuclease/exonuclease/phosphatase domain-containing protein n=1 Tax=Portunus trituberculatus TaxID=210409 RepID=A0A5B7FAH3_PORTR|nr:hypothetical protein [Portunus trituberculatus]